MRDFRNAALASVALLALLCAPQAVQVSGLRSEAQDAEYRALSMGEIVGVRLYHRDRQKVRELALYAFKAEGLGWGEEEADDMAEIAWRESRFSPVCQHPVSSSYGLFGFLDSTWEGARVKKTADPFLQTLAAVRYVRARYKTTAKALAWHDSHGWY